MTVQIILQLPDTLAQDAHEFGLLEPQNILALLQSELDQRINEIVNEEIHDYRSEQRSQDISKKT